MPNTSSKDLRRLALMGAEGRIESLRAEIAAIVDLFPELKNAAGGAGGRGGRAAKKAASGGVSKRNWNMSASQRKAVSARMKKYWAARRKEKAAGAAKS
jgi:hypothetical protein